MEKGKISRNLYRWYKLWTYETDIEAQIRSENHPYLGPPPLPPLILHGLLLLPISFSFSSSPFVLTLKCYSRAEKCRDCLCLSREWPPLSLSIFPFSLPYFIPLQPLTSNIFAIIVNYLPLFPSLFYHNAVWPLPGRFLPQPNMPLMTLDVNTGRKKNCNRYADYRLGHQR